MESTTERRKGAYRMMWRTIMAAALVTACAQASDGESAGPGLVVGYGTILSPPYVFSGVGTTELLLNGLLYQQFAPEVAPSPAATTFRDSVEVDLVRRMAAARDSLPNDEARAAIRRILEECDQVERIYSIGPGLMSVKVALPWSDAIVLLLPDPAAATPRPPAIESAQKSAIEFFEYSVRAGACIAFGRGYGIRAPAVQVPALREALEAARSGTLLAVPASLESFAPVLVDVARSGGHPAPR